MDVIVIDSFEEIYQTLEACKEDFFNQSLNSVDAITALSIKFASSAVVAKACTENCLQGFVAYYANNLDTKMGFVSMIIVKSEAQRKGVGTFLLQYVENDCKNRGIKSISLEVNLENKQAIEFYLKNGWIEATKKKEESLYLQKIF